MDIEELYSKMKGDKFLRATLEGSIELKGKSIIWAYEIYETVETEYCDCYDEEDDSLYCFERPCNEELLFETQRDDLEEIRDFINDLNLETELEFSEAEIIDKMISFKIY